MSSLTSLDHLGRRTCFDRCDLSHDKMEEFKGKEIASFGKEQNFKISSLCIFESVMYENKIE